jgi:hypothetical protein
MIDQNRDGFIDHDDLKDMLASLGKVRTSLTLTRHFPGFCCLAPKSAKNLTFFCQKSRSQNFCGRQDTQNLQMTSISDKAANLKMPTKTFFRINSFRKKCDKI